MVDRNTARRVELVSTLPTTSLHRQPAGEVGGRNHSVLPSVHIIEENQSVWLLAVLLDRLKGVDIVVGAVELSVLDSR